MKVWNTGPGHRAIMLGVVALVGALLMWPSLLPAQEQSAAPAAEEQAPPPGEGVGEDAGDDAGGEPVVLEPPDELPYPELVLGAVTEGATGDEADANFSFFAQRPGLLTIVVRGKTPRLDLALSIYGPEGAVLPQGNCDIDFNGDGAAEQLAVLVTTPGLHRVQVQPLSSGGGFWIGASWITHDDAAAAAPAAPTEAEQLTPGTAQTASLNGQNPAIHWFQYTPEREGFLVVSTRVSNGEDLVLEMFQKDHGFVEPMEYSDQDHNNDLSNERIAIEVVPGQTYYFRVRDYGESVPMQVRVASRLYTSEEGE